MKIIDAFPFFNELDLLEIRLSELDDCVDFFVLVEASKTQSLLPKPFYFEENKARFEKWTDKIIHIKVDDCPDNSRDLWEMERFQRNCISRGLVKLNLNDDDVVLISDLDEIPKAEKVRMIKLIDSQYEKVFPFSFEQDFYAYFLNLKCSNQKWIGTVAAQYSQIKISSPQSFRSAKDVFQVLPDSGWHFSWLGGGEAVWRKANSCIEPFDKSNLPSKEEYINFFDKYKESKNRAFIKTEDLTPTNQIFETQKLDNSFPLEILTNKFKYKEYLL